MIGMSRPFGLAKVLAGVAQAQIADLAESCREGAEKRWLEEMEKPDAELDFTRPAIAAAFGPGHPFGSAGFGTPAELRSITAQGRARIPRPLLEAERGCGHLRGRHHDGGSWSARQRLARDVERNRRTAARDAAGQAQAGANLCSGSQGFDADHGRADRDWDSAR